MKMPEEILEKSEKLKIEEEQARSVKERIRSRQHEVHLLHLQGFNNRQIADKLGISLSTVEKDLHVVREEIKSWIEDFRSKEVYYSFRGSYEQLEQIQKELWKKYQEEKDPKVQIRILDCLADKIIKLSFIVKERKNMW